MIGRLVFVHDRKAQLLFAVIGAIIGFVLLLCAIELFLNIKGVINQPSVTGQDYLVVNKEVDFLGDPSFTSKEIKELEEQEFVRSLAPIENSSFESFVQVDLPGDASFNTLMPLMSIPDEFLSVMPEGWKWDKTLKEVPIIVPNSFFKSYNFSIAESVNSPRISREILSNISPSVRISGKGKATKMKLKVVAFSDRYSDGVIVPKSFLDAMNQEYGNGPNSNITRVVLSTPNAKAPNIQAFLNKRAYETNSEKLKGGKINQLLNITLPILLIIAFTIIVLAVISFLQYAQILLLKSSYETKLLLQLGYRHQDLSKIIMRKFTGLFVLILLIAIPLVLVVKYILNRQFIEQLEIDLGLGLEWITILIGLLVFGGLYLGQVLSVRKEVKKLAKLS